MGRFISSRVYQPCIPRIYSNDDDCRDGVKWSNTFRQPSFFSTVFMTNCDFICFYFCQIFFFYSNFRKPCILSLSFLSTIFMVNLNFRQLVVFKIALPSDLLFLNSDFCQHCILSTLIFVNSSYPQLEFSSTLHFVNQQYQCSNQIKFDEKSSCVVEENLSWRKEELKKYKIDAISAETA